MRKNNSWLTALLAVLFLVIPAICIYYFFLPDWTNQNISNELLLGIGFGYFFYGTLISIFLIAVRTTSIFSLNFFIPLTIVFFLIFVSTYFNIWVRVALVLLSILLTFPVSMFTTKISTILLKKQNKFKDDKSL